MSLSFLSSQSKRARTVLAGSLPRALGCVTPGCVTLAFVTLGLKILNVKYLVLFALPLAMLPASAQASDKLYKHRDANGVVTFSDAPMVNGRVERQSYSSFKRTPVAANPCKGFSRAQLIARGNALNDQFAQAARQFAIDPALIKAVARAESCFDPAAVSRAGAIGLMQLMPTTASDMGVANIRDQHQNLIGGARYLSAMLNRYADNTQLALAAYNAGPGNVDKYNGIPPFSETRRYITSVNTFRQAFSKDFPLIEAQANDL